MPVPNRAFALTLLARMNRSAEGISDAQLRALHAGWVLGHADGLRDSREAAENSGRSLMENPVDP